ncbi:MAG: NAD(P)-dependent oxidoreductase, partial [Halobacteria archaeon]|nr:NAD(P)-dependent oxidoreductase [Halobacteria archaeon]
PLERHFSRTQTMRVFIAGSTGVLGKRLVEEFVKRSHDVVGLTRDDRGDKIVEERGGEPRRGDILDKESLIDAIDGNVDVVIHAATAIPTKMKPSNEDWKMNDRVRREGTENLVEAAGEADADTYLQQSITWVAKQPDGSKFDESSDVNPDRVTRSAVDAERIAKKGGEEHGFDVGVIRCGWFYSHDSAHTRMMAENLLKGRLPIIGGGILGRRDAKMSFSHVDDAARAFVTVAESGIPNGDNSSSQESNLWHVVDDRPVTYADFISELADRLDASSPRRIPAWLARFFVGSYNADFFTSPIPTTNEKFRRDFDWEPEYPTYKEGLQKLVNEWESEGTIVETQNGYRWNA